ncbi:recombinase family protein [Pseudoduganella lutea]|uniref:Resolvase n=1 Tax=Pseudoduganella lutea TaxID=321985 RepID=A0A4V0Z3Q6_9BURK|nr:recombinase family protein [Pseudoduganella lutea]QBE64273.1 resolvase [Pseudoduganella lutea]
MFVRAYLRASTKEQDATRAKSQLEAFAAEKSLKIAAFYIENESGASLKRPKLFELIEDATQGDILLIEQVDRLSRLDEADWKALKLALDTKHIKVVALDLPTSWIMTTVTTDETMNRMFRSFNDMMLDMLAAVARKDYVTRRERAAQGVEKAKAAGKYKGRKEDTERNALIQRHLKAGQSSWKEIMELVGCSRGTVAKQAELLKAQQAA